MIRASIVIVTHGQRALTEQCLESLAAALGDRLGVDWEVVVVDNCSPDDTPALLRQWSDRIRVELLEENRNFAGGSNLGAELAQGAALVFLNNDTVVPAGALETLVEQLEEPGVAAAGCRLLFPDGTIQHAGVAFVRDRVLGGVPMGAHVLHKQDQSLAGAYASYELDCVTAACMAIRADVFRTMEGFDERFQNGLEDVDLCLRLRRAGHRIVYRGDLTVMHHEGASRGREEALWATPERRALMVHNQTLLTERWRELLEPDDELAARVWDAELNGHGERRDHALADVMIVGQCGGIGPAADESRAFLTLLSSNGATPGVIDEPWPTLRARMPDGLRAVLARGLRTRLPIGAPALHIPSGEHDRLEREPMVQPAIYRLASPRTALALDQAAQVWATCPNVAEAIAAQGLARELILVMAPPLPAPPPAGSGGAGALVVLPTHERALARKLLEALARWRTELPLRVLPTTQIRGFETELAELVPGAELLGVCAEEARFAELAGAADVVGVFDPSDPFERRALVAAATGTPVVIARSDGPAAWVLDDLVGCAAGADDVPARLADLAGRDDARATQRDRVIAACASAPQPLVDTPGAPGPLIAIGRPRLPIAPYTQASVTVGASVAPLVSVVIAAGDDGRLLADAIDSALAQADPGGPLELIVVDDGSTDDTPAILARYAGRVRAVRQPQAGRIAAIDRGFELARGSYVALLDAADQLPRDRLARQVAMLEAKPEVGLVHGDVELIDEHGRALVSSLRVRDGLKAFDGRVLGKLLAGNFVATGAATFRAALLPALRPIAAEATDLDWWIATCIAAVAQLRLERGSGSRRRRDSDPRPGSGPSRRTAGEREREPRRSELPWRRWMLRNLLRDDTITVPDMTAAFASFSRSLQAEGDATGSADPVAAAEVLATLPDAGAGAPRSRTLLRALACDPFDAETLAAIEPALAGESQLEQPAPAPPLISLETRSRVTLAWLGEALSEPALLRGYAAAGDEQRSLVILAPPQADLSPLERLFDSDPALGSEACDAIVIAEPATPPAMRLLCARADSRLTLGDPPPPYEQLPIDPAVERIVVRRRAPSATATRR